MAKCTRCGNEINEPMDALKNDSFTVETFHCDKCHNRFKVVNNIKE